MISLSTDIADKILLDSLNSSQYGIGKSLERLTSGFKLNHAADNAAGISIVTNLNSKISSLFRFRITLKTGFRFYRPRRELWKTFRTNSPDCVSLRHRLRTEPMETGRCRLCRKRRTLLLRRLNKSAKTQNSMV